MAQFERTRRGWLAVSIVVGLTALMLTAAGCGGSKKNASSTPTASSSGTQSKVAVNLLEYQIQAKPASVAAGTVTFNVKNIGGTEHEMVVLRTELPPTALPTKTDGSADEEATEVTVVDEVPEVRAQQEKSLTIDMEPGTYVLICNTVQESNGQTVSHYAKGMTVAFTVTP